MEEEIMQLAKTFRELEKYVDELSKSKLEETEIMTIILEQRMK